MQIESVAHWMYYGGTNCARIEWNQWWWMQQRHFCRKVLLLNGLFKCSNGRSNKTVENTITLLRWSSDRVENIVSFFVHFVRIGSSFGHAKWGYLLGWWREKSKSRRAIWRLKQPKQWRERRRWQRKPRMEEHINFIGKELFSSAND